MINNETQINEKLKTELHLTNSLEVPRLIKVAINVGTGRAKTNPAFLKTAEESLMAITGQKPAQRQARQAIAGFKIRKGEKVGLQVTLRGKRMKDFVTKLANIVLPRMRDFRGLKAKGFDKNGNYTLGISEQIVFPEISHEKALELFGLSITIVSTAKNAEQGKALLEAWGLPFEGKKLSSPDINSAKKEQNG